MTHYDHPQRVARSAEWTPCFSAPSTIMAGVPPKPLEPRGSQGPTAGTFTSNQFAHVREHIASKNKRRSRIPVEVTVAERALSSTCVVLVRCTHYALLRDVALRARTPIQASTSVGIAGLWRSVPRLSWVDGTHLFAGTARISERRSQPLGGHAHLHSCIPHTTYVRSELTILGGGRWKAVHAFESMWLTRSAWR